MKPKSLSPDFSVSGQLITDDIAIVHAMGFRSIICNRPDGESIDQPMLDTIRTVAKRSNIQTAYVPIENDGPTKKDVMHMAEMMDKLPKPILAFSKTGTRSEALLRQVIESNSKSTDA